MHPLLNDVLDVLLPRACSHCRRDLRRGEGPLCRACVLPRAPDPSCVRCGGTRGAAPFCSNCRAGRFACRLIRARASHRGPAASLVHAFKFRGCRPAAVAAGRAMAEEFHLLPELGGFDALCPVPAHARRERERGYNQAEVIAREVAANSGIPMMNLLERRKGGGPSWRLGKVERTAELADAYGAIADASGRRILLIDDVAATGTTLEECAKALRNAGASDVAAYVFARAGTT